MRGKSSMVPGSRHMPRAARRWLTCLVLAVPITAAMAQEPAVPLAPAPAASAPEAAATPPSGAPEQAKQTPVPAKGDDKREADPCKACADKCAKQCAKEQAFPWPTVITCLIFFAAMLGVRWNMVARPAQEQLEAEIDAVGARRIAAALPAPQDEQVKTLVLGARKRLDLDKPVRPRWLMNVLFWSRGQEHMGFQLLHEAKQTLVAHAPAEVLRVEMEDAAVQLRQDKTTEATTLADELDAELKRSVVALDDRAGAALREILSMLEHSASQAKADLDAATAPQGTATADEIALLARRLLIDLAKDRQAALDAALQDVLRAPAAGTPDNVPPEYRMLLTHASSVFLPRAEAARAALQTACDQAGLSVDGWRGVLASYTKGYVESAESLRRRIEAALAGAPLRAPERWRALASEAKHLLYERADARFVWTASWHKKTAWLCFVGLALVCVLAAVLHQEVLFLMGALGGLISRLQRGLSRDKVAVDYGQSWNTLFLSPVVGALVGWAGVLLVIVAVKWGLLGKLFAEVVWDQPKEPIVLGIALLLGLSESLFVTVVQGLEGKAGIKSSEGDATNTETETKTDGTTTTTTTSTPDKSLESKKS